MKKSVSIAAVFAFTAGLGLAAVASADTMIPGQYSQQDQSVMGVGQTIVQMGSHQRTLTDAVNRASRADRSRSSSTGLNVDFQFGSSQSDNSWKAARSVEEAQVRGLVPGDCQGDNSTEAYRKQMGQDRKGYMAEPLVSNDQCGEYHPTIK
jgi:hypothetical protein